MNETVIPKAMKTFHPSDPNPPASWLGTLLLWAGILVLARGLVVFQDFQFPLRVTYSLPTPALLLSLKSHILGGMILVMLGSWMQPSRRESDLSRGAAWGCLALILAAGAFMAFYGIGTPHGKYWDDWAINVTDARNVVERSIRPLIFRIGGREPFHIYLMSVLMALFPDLMGFVVQRLASGLVFLTGLWVFYLLGVEIRSRRTGLLLAGLGVAGRPFLMQVIAGMRIETMILAVAWLVLALLRLGKKPSMSRFLVWGLAMAFGTFTYTAFRPWTLVLPGLVFLWFWFRREERGAGWVAWILPIQVFWLWTVYFFRFHLGAIGGWPEVEGVFEAWNKAEPFWRQLFWGATLATLAKAMAVREQKGLGRRLAAWALACLVALACVYPLTLDDEFYSRISQYSVANQGPMKAGYILDKFAHTLRMLYMLSDDRDDLNLGPQPVLDHVSWVATLFGLAALLARPDRTRGLLLLMAVFGLLPHTLSSETASTKLMGGLVPLLALAALGLDELVSATRALRPRWLTGTFALLVMFGAMGVGMYQQFNVLHLFWSREDQANALVSREIREGLARGERIYLSSDGPSWGELSQSVMNDGLVYYELDPGGVIEVPEGEPQPTVTLILSRYATKVRERLKAEFPQAIWTPIDSRSLVPSRRIPGLVFRVTIPPGTLPETPGKILSIRRVKGKPVVRRYNCWHYGMGRGGYMHEDRAAKWGDPVDPAELSKPPYNYHDGLGVMRAIGRFRADTDGVYEWIVTPIRKVWIRVDGRQVAAIDPRDGSSDRRVRVRLKAGEHEFEYKVLFAGQYTVPAIRLLRPGATQPEAF